MEGHAFATGVSEIALRSLLLLGFMQHWMVVFNNISGRPIIPIFKGQAVQEEIIYFILKPYDILKVKNALVKSVLPYKV